MAARKNFSISQAAKLFSKTTDYSALCWILSMLSDNKVSGTVKGLKAVQSSCFQLIFPNPTQRKHGSADISLQDLLKVTEMARDGLMDSSPYVFKEPCTLHSTDKFSASNVSALLMDIVAMSAHAQQTLVCAVDVIASEDPTEMNPDFEAVEKTRLPFVPRTIMQPIFHQGRYMLMIWVVGTYNGDEPIVMFFDSMRETKDVEEFSVDGIYAEMTRIKVSCRFDSLPVSHMKYSLS